MWPHGWNSAWPGKPAFSRWARPPPTTTLLPGDENTTLQNYEQLVQKYEKSREEVENHLKLMAKADLSAFLDCVALKSTRTAAINASIRSLFRKRGISYTFWLVPLSMMPASLEKYCARQKYTLCILNQKLQQRCGSASGILLKLGREFLITLNLRWR